MSPAATDEMTREELAEQTGLAVRTIRYYHSAGVLPQPVRRGRNVMYNGSHVERLELIRELHDRGLTIPAIRSLVSGPSKAETRGAEDIEIDDILGLPWTEDRPEILDDAAIEVLLENRSPVVVARLLASGLLERQSSDAWLVPSPGLLRLSLVLEDAGVDIEISAKAVDLLRKRLSTAVDELIALFVENAGDGYAGTQTKQELKRALDALRPVAREAAGLVLAQEIERGMAAMLEELPSTSAGDSSHSRRRSGARPPTSTAGETPPRPRSKHRSAS